MSQCNKITNVGLYIKFVIIKLTSGRTRMNTNDSKLTTFYYCMLVMMKIVFINLLSKGTNRPLTLICMKYMSQFNIIQSVRKKRSHVIFNYNSRIFWSIFIIFVPLETGVNT